MTNDTGYECTCAEAASVNPLCRGRTWHLERSHSFGLSVLVKKWDHLPPLRCCSPVPVSSLAEFPSALTGLGKQKTHSQPACPSRLGPAKAQVFDICFLETAWVQAEGEHPSPWAQSPLLDFMGAEEGFLPTQLQALGGLGRGLAQLNPSAPCAAWRGEQGPW